MTPTIGRIVHYRLSDGDAQAITTARGDKISGNGVHGGDTYPAMIVRVFGDAPRSAVNLKVFLDGGDTYWATSRTEGEGEFHWSWPPRSA